MIVKCDNRRKTLTRSDHLCSLAARASAVVRIADVVEPREGPNPVGTLSPESCEVSCHRLALVRFTEESIVTSCLGARDEWDEDEHDPYKDDEGYDDYLCPKSHSHYLTQVWSRWNC